MDVGGAAKPVKDRVQSWDVKEYNIIDNGLEESHESVRLYQKADFNNNLPWNEWMNNSGINFIADIVFCLEVFEYIYNPQQAMVNINYITHPGSELYITFPFIYPIHNPKESDYLRYTGYGAVKLIEDAGFKILEVIPRTMTIMGATLYKSFIREEGMHAAKEVDHNILGVIIKAQKQ